MTAPRSLHSLEIALRKHMSGTAPLAAGDRVIVSVSGGSDSTALLLLLHALRDRLGFSLEAIHFDHGLRPDSAREADWVARLAQRLEVPVHLRQGFDPPSKENGMQAAARKWRRGESLALLDSTGARWIATGHQRDDHLETLLLKLLRGVHLAHIRGLEPWAEPWMHPLLAFSRSGLQAYLRERRQDWLEDPSNRWPKYTRNRVRHELMPLLNSLAQGGIAARLEGLERQSRELGEWLAQVPRPGQNDPARPPHWIDADALAALPTLVRCEALHRFVQARLPGAIDAPTVEKAAELVTRSDPWELHLAQGRTLSLRGRRLLLLPRAAAAEPREMVAGAWRLRIADGLDVSVHDPGSGRGGLTVHNLDPAAPLTVRQRLPGDRFHPERQKRPVKLAGFLRDQGVPPWERDHLPLVLTGEEVVAVYPRFVGNGHKTPAPGGRSLRIEICGW